MAGYNRPALVAELIRDEGLKLRVYRDTASPPRRSIGIGRNLDDVGISPDETHQLGITVASCTANGITRDHAFALCSNDIDRAERALDSGMPWWRSLSDVRQRVLLNMCFNMGLGTLLGFVNTMKAVQAGQYAAAADGMLASRWATQTGDRAKRLAQMMRTGQPV